MYGPAKKTINKLFIKKLLLFPNFWHEAFQNEKLFGTRIKGLFKF